MNKSEKIDELAAALAKAQGIMKVAIKDSENPFYKNKYADIASVWDACREALSSNGLSITQFPDVVVRDGIEKIVLVNTLLHSSGQWMESIYPITPVKNDPQGIGSAITYARRYSLAAISGVAQDDDDGAQASKQKTMRPTIKKEVIESVVSETIMAVVNNDKSALDEIWDEFTIEEQVALWQNFTAKERAQIKKLKEGKNNDT